MGPSVEAICVWLHRVLSKDLFLIIDDLQVLLLGSAAAAIVEGLCRQAPGPAASGAGIPT